MVHQCFRVMVKRRYRGSPSPVSVEGNGERAQPPSQSFTDAPKPPKTESNHVESLYCCCNPPLSCQTVSSDAPPERDTFSSSTPITVAEHACTQIGTSYQLSRLQQCWSWFAGASRSKGTSKKPRTTIVTIKAHHCGTTVVSQPCPSFVEYSQYRFQHHLYNEMAYDELARPINRYQQSLVSEEADSNGGYC